MKAAILFPVLLFVFMVICCPVYADNAQQACPPLSEFPLMERVFGQKMIQIGDSADAHREMLNTMGSISATAEQMRFHINLEDHPDSDLVWMIESIIFTFQDGSLRGARIVYQVDQWADLITKSELEQEFENLLGGIDGYIRGPEEKLYPAWQKGSVIIAIDYIDLLQWYILELYDQGR